MNKRKGSAVLLLLLLAAVVAGVATYVIISSGDHKVSIPPASAATKATTATTTSALITPQFFAMSNAVSNDMPKVTYGTLGHPAQLVWTAVEGTARGTYNFTAIDQFVKKAPKDANGVAQIDLTLGYTPGWAVANHANCITLATKTVACTVPPDNIADWTNFVTTLVKHYNGVTAPHVKYYELWNEANTPQFWTTSTNALVTLAQVAYPIVHTDPYSSLLTPSVIWSGTATTTPGTVFMALYLQNGGANYADGVTFHGYTSKTPANLKGQIPLPESASSTNEPIQGMVAAYRTVADANGMQGKPLMVTEGGWGVRGVTDPDMQAAWLAQWLALQAGFVSNDNLQFANWFSWGVNQPSGFVETASGTPNEAGVAYSVVNGWLVNQIASLCSNSGNIWSCAVGPDLIVWDASQKCSGGSCTTSIYNPPAGYSSYTDLTGTTYQLSLGSTIALGVKPILLTASVTAQAKHL